MALFDRYLMIDWSAASQPVLGRNSIWACLAVCRNGIVTAGEPINFATRSLLMAYLGQQVDGAVGAGERLLAGFDFAFGYPKGAAEKITGKPGWKALWDFLATHIEDGDDNSNNRFELAGRLNLQAFAETPLYWGMPNGNVIDGLTMTRPASNTGDLSQKRIAEMRATGAQSVWKLAYPGSVGGQALVGIARLAKFCNDPARRESIGIWPFETGFAASQAAPCIFAEIYPSLFSDELVVDAIPDRAQVQLLATKFAQFDSCGDLEELLSKPADVVDEDIQTIISEEGWILGLGADQPAKTRYQYIREPAEIYRQSFATIRAEADLSRFPKGMDELVIRLIHASGMVDLAADVVSSACAHEIGLEALKRGAPILCDVEMVRHGVIAKLLPGNNDVVCLLNEPQVTAHAKLIANTRSAAQVDFWGKRLEGAVVAIGNAPTALFRLLELIGKGGPKPALILGFPVGFVGAAESKQALADNPYGVPFISVRGRRGGSAMASAAVNALGGGLKAND